MSVDMASEGQQRRQSIGRQIFTKIAAKCLQCHLAQVLVQATPTRMLAHHQQQWLAAATKGGFTKLHIQRAAPEALGEAPQTLQDLQYTTCAQNIEARGWGPSLNAAVNVYFFWLAVVLVPGCGLVV